MYDVEHPEAYEAAIKARIKANASKTRRKNWLATHPDAQRLWDWLHGCGEFESRFKCGAVINAFESQFGYTYINICKDADGNVVVYKGSNRFEEGETVRVKATVKSHEERDGVAQTLIARPKAM